MIVEGVMTELTLGIPFENTPSLRSETRARVVLFVLAAVSPCAVTLFHVPSALSPVSPSLTLCNLPKLRP